MVRHKSALKAARQAVKKTARNSQARAHYRTQVKKLRAALAGKQTSKEAAKTALAPLLNETQRILMKAASKGLIKPNTASRQISRLSIAVHKALA